MTTITSSPAIDTRFLSVSKGAPTRLTAISQTLDTPDGPFTILAREDGAVLASGWSADQQTMLERIRPADRPIGTTPGVIAAAEAVVAYYDGELTAIDDVPVAQFGGPFRTHAWTVLRTIAAGRPVTYTEFAAASGRPSAVRAAASACATNAPALFVPCHRVLRTDGSLGGFAWGLDVKRSLLDREAALS
ncbi:methylated-DNA--[protein]-cysteine S-methyltransferase [Plantibacter flavus]|uniref:methylated-DNA--[protein]-cysteine S-methyltransferase n=1 Tax=Plantibacter flavus TaxID=150123 RepID=UPI003F181B58